MITIEYDDNKTIFKTIIPVLVKHLNYGNHLGYDSLLTIVQDARMFWLKEHQMSEASIENSIGFLVKALVVDYQSEAFHGDLLLVELYACDLSKASFSLKYKVSHAQSQKNIALVHTKQVFFDYTLRKVAKIPERFREIV